MDLNLFNRVNKNLADLQTADIKKSLDNNIKTKDRQAMHEACRGFESIFLDTMLKAMRKTVPEDKLFGDGNGMDIYKSMHDQYLTRDISESGSGIGLEDFFFRHVAK